MNVITRWHCEAEGLKDDNAGTMTDKRFKSRSDFNAFNVIRDFSAAPVIEGDEEEELVATRVCDIWSDDKLSAALRGFSSDALWQGNRHVSNHITGSVNRGLTHTQYSNMPRNPTCAQQGEFFFLKLWALHSFIARQEVRVLMEPKAVQKEQVHVFLTSNKI